MGAGNNRDLLPGNDKTLIQNHKLHMACPLYKIFQVFCHDRHEDDVRCGNTGCNEPFGEFLVN